MDCGIIAALILFVTILLVVSIKSKSRFERKFVSKTLLGLDMEQQAAQEAELAARAPLAPAPQQKGPVYSGTASVMQSALPISPYPLPPATAHTASYAPTEQTIVQAVDLPTAPLVTDTKRANKKGFVAGVRDPTCASKIAVLNCDWYYTWGSKPPPTGPPGLLFTPMYWSIANAPSSALASFSVNNVPAGWDPVNLLTYNEPDGTNAGAQANMKVGDAVAKWPALAATGRRLGSPVMFGSLLHSGSSPNNTPLPPNGSAPVVVNISNDPKAPNNVTLDPTIWLDNFLIQINLLPTRPRNPDFICVHWYGPPKPASFLNYLTAVNAKYRLPIWVTEYSCADWPATCCSGDPPGTVHTTIPGISWDSFNGTLLDAAQNSTANFMQQTVQGMEAMPFVEKYSWKERFKLVPFTNPTGIQGDSQEGPGNPDHMNQSALFDSYVHFPMSLPPLTPLGQLYASF